MELESRMLRTFTVIIALLSGLIFFAGSTASLAMQSKTQASKKPQAKRPASKKGKG